MATRAEELLDSLVAGLELIASRLVSTFGVAATPFMFPAFGPGAVAHLVLVGFIDEQPAF
jgi:hypothetical protein